MVLTPVSRYESEAPCCRTHGALCPPHTYTQPRELQGDQQATPLRSLRAQRAQPTQPLPAPVLAQFLCFSGARIQSGHEKRSQNVSLATAYALTGEAENSG